MKNYSKLLIAMALAAIMGTGLYAQPQQPVKIETTVSQIQYRIGQLEYQLADLKAVSTKGLNKADKKQLKRQKKAVKQALAAEKNVLNRLTGPQPIYYGRYGAGFYNAFSPYGYFNPNVGYPYGYYPVRRINVAPQCPPVQNTKVIRTTPTPSRTARRPNTTANKRSNR